MVWVQVLLSPTTLPSQGFRTYAFTESDKYCSPYARVECGSVLCYVLQSRLEVTRERHLFFGPQDTAQGMVPNWISHNTKKPCHRTTVRMQGPGPALVTRRTPTGGINDAVQARGHIERAGL